ncbi:MAG: hypothetical protein M3441_19570 [Chloroflexota bacterium]|nr:hypothetical protein [Chloroflexota bacterium]
MTKHMHASVGIGTLRLQNSLRTTLETAIPKLESGPVLSRFISAYQKRREYPWLNEAQFGTDGLAHAIAIAFAMYLVPEVVGQDKQTSGLDGLPRNYDNGYEKVTKQQMAQLREATAKAVVDIQAIEAFASALSRAGIDLANINNEELETHVLGALFNYYEKQYRGLSQDPL